MGPTGYFRTVLRAAPRKPLPRLIFLRPIWPRAQPKPPFQALRGLQPRTPVVAAAGAYDELALSPSALHALIFAMHERLTVVHELAAAERKARFDAATTPVPFKVGDWVWWVKEPANKLDVCRGGPFQVVADLGGNVYRIRDQYGSEREDHAERMQLANMARFDVMERARRSLKPGFSIVKSVIDHRLVDGTWEVKVSWLDWGSEYDKWMPVSDAPIEHVRKYIDTHPTMQTIRELDRVVRASQRSQRGR